MGMVDGWRRRAGGLTAWKIRLGLAFGVVDVLVLAWLVGDRAWAWLAAALVVQ
jgi:hypothetical protein